MWIWIIGVGMDLDMDMDMGGVASVNEHVMHAARILPRHTHDTPSLHPRHTRDRFFEGRTAEAARPSH